MTMMTKVTKNGLNNSLHGMSGRLFSSGSAHLIRNVLMVMSYAGKVGQVGSLECFKSTMQISQLSVARKVRRDERG